MAYVSANWGEEPYLQTKNTTVTPGANWSGAETNAAEINPDSGYDAMEKVNVKVPMLRDYTLMTVSQAETPSTVYNGNTAQSNSAKMLRVAPTKDGMSYTNSYLEVPASSAMGNATAADVAEGKTFSSGNGIALTGTGQMGEDLREDSLIKGFEIYKPRYVYDGNTRVSNDKILLKIAPGVNGTAHTKNDENYKTLYLDANSYLGTATKDKVLNTCSFSSQDGICLSGGMIERSASSETISAAKTYSKGYYPNDWTVTPDGGTAEQLDFYDHITKYTTQIAPKTTFSWKSYIKLEPNKTMNDVDYFAIILYDNAFVYTCVAHPADTSANNTYYTFSRTDATAGHKKTVASFTDEMLASNDNRIAFALRDYYGGLYKQFCIGYYPAYAKYSDKYDPECYIFLRLRS